MLNKSTLLREQSRYALYQRYLPALKLKQEELLRLKAQAEVELAELECRLKDLLNQVRAELPMLANERIDMAGLVRLAQVGLTVENVLGVVLPKLEQVKLEVQAYSPLARPHWVDHAVQVLQQALMLQVAKQVAERRCQLLAQAVKSATQRVNLLEKILIPKAIADIRCIRVFLEDLERAETIRAKLAKRKR